MKQNKDNQNKKQRSGFAVMCGLIGMIKPLLGIMCLAILMGCAGNLMATFLTILGGYALLTVTGVYSGMRLSVIFTLLVCFAVARGILRYAEQASNHYIAFKLLARIRHQVFDSLRRLAPAKLDGAKKGNLISIITSDIELLEVFYAHTISPIAIAVITSVVMTIFLGRIHPVFGVLALFFYVLVGAVIPVVNGRIGAAGGKEYREAFGALNTCVLDNLYGLEETLQYGQQEARIAKMAEQTGHLETVNGALKRGENLQRVITDGVILFAGVLAALVGGTLAENGSIPGSGAVIAVIALASSFGPTAALSALSNNLNHTLASGNRVLDILDEEPLVHEIAGRQTTAFSGAACEDVSFSYGEEPVLSRVSLRIPQGRVVGITGRSGSGKSTLLRLLMRFWDADGGAVRVSGRDVREVNTGDLRRMEGFVTQETHLFRDSIASNLRIGKRDATQAELEAACKKASVHEFILSLPKGYDTPVGELGDTLSGGERQRLGLARAFLHGAPFLLLDEPTSNLDSLNEGVILRSLQSERGGRTVVLVSHRASTMAVADEVYAAQEGRVS